MANHILAHDLGTTGNKATLYDREGRLAGSAFFAYAIEYGWTQAIARALRIEIDHATFERLSEIAARARQAP